MFTKRNYSKCEDGLKHDWQWHGGAVTERKTNRSVHNEKCSKCELVKQVFDSTGRRVSR